MLAKLQMNEQDSKEKIKKRPVHSTNINPNQLPEIPVRHEKIEVGSATISMKRINNQELLERLKPSVKLSPPILRPKAETVMSHYMKYNNNDDFHANYEEDYSVSKVTMDYSSPTPLLTANKNPYKSRQA